MPFSMRRLYGHSKHTMRSLRGCLLAIVLLACLPLPGNAASPTLDMHHTSWTARDGTPPFIIAMAQSADGWLWLAASSGLYRFDGVTFERVKGSNPALRSTNLWGMHLLDSGALWLGYRHGGASIWQNGKVRNYGLAEGLPPSSTLDFAEDASGRLWIATARGLFLFDGQRWASPAPQMLAPDSMCTLLRDQQRTLWAQCEGGVYQLPAGATHFTKVPGPKGIGRLVQAPDQTIWSVGGPKAEVVALSGPGMKRPHPAWPAPRFAGGTMLFERDGQHVWVVSNNGLVRTGPDGSSASFGMAQGLSGAMPNFILQDREGNIWVGTENGLDRFRPQQLSGVLLPRVNNDSVAIAAAPHGGLWVDQTLLKDPQRKTFDRLPKETPQPAVSVLWRESASSLWTGAHDGLWHEHDGQRQHLPFPANAPRDPHIYAIARDSAGAPWISLRQRGIYRWHDGAWSLPPGIPATMRASLLYRDTSGRMWLGMGDKGVAMQEHGRLRQFGQAEGLQVGIPLQILQVGKDVLVSGENGLFRYDGKRFHHLAGVGDDGLYGASGMLYVNDTLWLNGVAGITVIDGQQLRLAARDPGHRLRFRRLDHKDGLQGRATQSAPLPSAVAGTDGRLWFTTTAGLFWLDPGKQTSNPLPPPVQILRVSADGVSHPITGDASVALPALPARVQIDYTALSLSMPERMQFAYRLEGIDHQWQDGGSSRSTTYTDLPPGSYRFLVKASNNDGVWSNAVAETRFSVAPTLYQSHWFRTLCAIALALMLWWLYRLRLRQVKRQLRARFGERLDERERISRELHDTFLQTVQGLVLKIHSLSLQMPADAPMRQELERSLATAEKALEEGRDRVQALRTSTELQSELVAAVSAAVGDVYRTINNAGGAVLLHAQGSGTVRPLQPEVHEELFAIAREALLNAAHHADAGEVRFDVTYGVQQFSMCIADNGKGLPASVLQAGGPGGHFGIVGMRERAARIGATLNVTSSAQGTQWQLLMPARRAYLS